MTTTTDASEADNSTSSKRDLSNASQETSNNKRIKIESVLESLPPLNTKSADNDDGDEKETKETAPMRWKAHCMMEDYVDTVGKLMFPGMNYMFNPLVPMERVSALGYLTSRMRRRHVWEDWSPREIALFEAAILQKGKDFSKISKSYLPNKTTKDVVAFYYMWKKTKHYTQWKAQYQPDDGAWVLEEPTKKQK